MIQAEIRGSLKWNLAFLPRTFACAYSAVSPSPLICGTGTHALPGSIFHAGRIDRTGWTKSWERRGYLQERPWMSARGEDLLLRDAGKLGQGAKLEG